jgi:ABC-type uncharacterized transport system substrate-binding protein
MKKLLFLLLVLFTFSAYAHPHMFITSETTFVFNSEKLEGFFVEWTFDEMFSSTIISEYDKDRSGSFDVKETAVVKKNAFDYVSESKFFINMKINGKTKTIKKVSKFTAKIRNNRLVYRFFVPLSIKAEKKDTTVNFSVFDETFYIDFDVKKPEVESNIAIEQSVKMTNYAKATDYYGQRPSKDIVVKFKKK